MDNNDNEQYDGCLAGAIVVVGTFLAAIAAVIVIVRIVTGSL